MNFISKKVFGLLKKSFWVYLKFLEGLVMNEGGKSLTGMVNCGQGIWMNKTKCPIQRFKISPSRESHPGVI